LDEEIATQRSLRKYSHLSEEELDQQIAQLKIQTAEGLARIKQKKLELAKPLNTDELDRLDKILQAKREEATNVTEQYQRSCDILEANKQTLKELDNKFDKIKSQPPTGVKSQKKRRSHK
jgi:transketolase